MRDGRNEHRGRLRGPGEDSGERIQPGGNVADAGQGTDVEGIDHRLIGARASPIIIGGESAGRQHMQVGDDLQGRSPEGVDLARHGGSDRDGGRDSSPYRRILLGDAGPHRGQRHLRTLERSGRPSPLHSGFDGDLARASPDIAVPQHPVDLVAGLLTCLADTGDVGEGSEGIAAGIDGHGDQHAGVR